MNASYEVEKSLARRLSIAVAKEIDIPKLAKKLAPKISKAISDRVIKTASRIEMDDFVHDCMGKEFYETMERLLITALKKQMKR